MKKAIFSASIDYSYTQPCKTRMAGFCCENKKCTYAHSKEELRFPKCAFDVQCRNNYCKLFHPKMESNEEFVKRTNYVYPDFPEITVEVVKEILPEIQEKIIIEIDRNDLLPFLKEFEEFRKRTSSFSYIVKKKDERKPTETVSKSPTTTPTLTPTEQN